MEWLIDILRYVGNHHIAAIWIAIFLAAILAAASHKLAQGLNAAYAKKLKDEEESLDKLAAELACKERAIASREASLSARESEIEVEISLRVAHELTNKESTLDKVRLELQDREASVGEREAELERQIAGLRFKRVEPALSEISRFLPSRLYGPLLNASYSKELITRIASALDGSISIAGGFTCKADVNSSSREKTYSTTLTSCTCEDFKKRGGPCKHMLHLLFSIAPQCQPFSQTDPKDGPVSLIKSLKKDYEKKARAEKGKYEYMEEEINALRAENHSLRDNASKHEANLRRILDSNLTAIPWLAGMMADFLTYDLEVEAQKLEWGSSIQRKKKVASIRDIRADAQARIQEAKEAAYQLGYLRTLYPALDNILKTDYREIRLSEEIPE